MESLHTSFELGERVIFRSLPWEFALLPIPQRRDAIGC